MLVRLGLALISSVVALKYAQLKRNWDVAHLFQKPHSEEEFSDSKEIYTYAEAHATKEEEAEIKHVSSSSRSRSCQEQDQLLLPEFDDLFQGGIDFHSDSERSSERIRLNDDGMRNKYESDESIESRKYDSNSEDDEALSIFEALATSAKTNAQVVSDLNGSAHFAHLKALVASLQEKEMKLEAELLECYALKEQEENYLHIERQLSEKNEEIQKLSVKLSSVEEQVIDLSKEVEGKETLREELNAAQAKVNDLQMMMQSDDSQTKAHLLILKQQVSILKEKEKEFSKQDFDMEGRLQTLKESEVEVLELRRTRKDLQHQKRELAVKLNVADAKIIQLSSVTESDKVAQVQFEVSTLKFANEDLSKQVEGLQMNRFSEVEELVYLRWVNACLRYELRNHQAPPGKASALDLGKSLSPKSQERAKQLMMEYASPELLAPKPGESASLLTSTISECEPDDVSFDDIHSSSKRSRFTSKLKKWGRSKEAPELSLAASSTETTKSRMQSTGHRRTTSRGSLENLFMRSSNDPHRITTTFGINGFENTRQSTSDFNMLETTSSETRSSVDGSDLSSEAASSFECMSKSMFSVSEGKYPPFKDQHKLALERESVVKEKADQARLEEKLEPEAPLCVKINKAVPSEIPSHSIVAPPPAEIFSSTVSLTSDKAIQRERDQISPIKVNNKAPKKMNFDRFPQSVPDLVVSATEPSPVHLVVNKMKLFKVEKREPRVPKPAPKSSSHTRFDSKIMAKPTECRVPNPPPPPPPTARTFGGPPPPPPPPGAIKLQGSETETVQRAPEVVEFYQSLMRRDAKKDLTMGASNVNISNVQNNMISEIENRSAFLLAVKADVETQGDFVHTLAIEVRTAAFDNIEDVIRFVSWLDEELSFLVDERAVLKHFDWPESKADVLREAAFEYQDLKKLDLEVSSFEDDPQMPSDVSLKRMLSLLEKVEQSVYAVLRTRDTVVARYKEFGVPTQWMLDSGLVGKIKLATVQLARKYMERVTLELDSSLETASTKEPHREFLVLQGVRFAFRVHQFAGGFDAESMHTFEELRRRVHSYSVDPSTNDLHEAT